MFRILVIAPDALGDQILRQPLYAAIDAAGLRLAVVCRRSSREILEILAPDAELIETDVDLSDESSAGNEVKFAELSDAVRKWNPDTILSPCKNPTWIGAGLFVAMPSVRRIAVIASGRADTRRLREINARRSRLASVSGEVISVEEGSHESEVCTHALRALGLLAPDRTAPLPVIRVKSLPDVSELLAREGLVSAAFAFSSPAGFTNVKTKSWPRDQLVETLAYLRLRHKLPVLLAGIPAEEEWLGSMGRETQSPVWIGAEGSLTTCMALMAHASCYIGTDTGMMHLASAMGLPVFGLFGGGTWGRFLPLSKRSSIVTQALPCFGCDWCCLFSEAHCITSVTSQAIFDGIAWLLEDLDEPGVRIDRGEPQSAVASRAFKSLIAIYEDSESDRAARLEAIYERDRFINELKFKSK